MARSRKLEFDLVADVADLRRGLAKVDKDIDKLAKTTKSAGSKVSSGFSGIATAAKLGGAAIAGGIVLEAKRAVTAFQESNKVSKQTQAVLKSTGGVAKVTARDVSDLADQISRKTGVDDEAIASGENLLLTFTNVRNEAGKGNDVFDRATRTITDMSVALGQDTKASAIQLGKALNDPIKGITALSRVGVSFTQQQKDQIKTLVESGDTLGAQKVILGELSKEFAGSAQAQATSTGKLKVAFGNLEEDLGSGLAPAVDKVANRLTHFAHDVEPDVIKAANRIGKIFGRKDLSLEQKFRLSRSTLQKNFEPLIDEARSALEKMHLGSKFSKLIEDAAPKIADAFATAAPRAAGAFVSAFKEAGPWGKLITVAFLAQKLGAFSAAGSFAGGKLVEGLKGALKRDKTLKAASAASGVQSGAAYAVAFDGAAATGVGKGGKVKTAMGKLGRAGGALAAIPFAAAFAEGIRTELANKADEMWAPVVSDLKAKAEALVNEVAAEVTPISAPRGGNPRDPATGSTPRRPRSKPKAKPKAKKSARASASASTSRVNRRVQGTHASTSSSGGGGIVALGNWLQGQGFTVSEHPSFGGVNPVHVAGSLHYTGNALDVNHDSGNEDAALTALAGQLQAAGWHVLWHVPDHYDHLHVDTASGAGSIPGDSGSDRLSATGSRSTGASKATKARRAFGRQQARRGSQHARQVAREKRSWTPGPAGALDLSMAEGENLLAEGDPAGAYLQAAAIKGRLEVIDRALKKKMKPARRARLLKERADLVGQLGDLQTTYGPQPADDAAEPDTSAIDANTAAIEEANRLAQEHNDLIASLNGELKRENDIRAQVREIDTPTILRAIGDVANQQIGGSVLRGLGTPAFSGGGMRY